MEKAIATALFVIASVVATLAMINAVMPAVGKSSSALLIANAQAADRIRTDADIVFAVGDTTTDVVTLWVKNVGSQTITGIDSSDMFLTTPTTAKRIVWADVADCATLLAGGTECWEYTLEDSATAWSSSKTLKVTVRLTALEAGVHKMRFSLGNGVYTEKDFSS